MSVKVDSEGRGNTEKLHLKIPYVELENEQTWYANPLSAVCENTGVVIGFEIRIK